MQNISLSSKRWVFLFHPQEERRETVFATLLFELPHISSQQLQQLVLDGAVYCNGERLAEDCTVPPVARLELFEPQVGYRESLQRLFDAVDERALAHCDEALIVAVKPSGLPTLPTRDQSHLNFKNAIYKLIQKMGITAQAHMPSRLDAPVMGLVPIAIGQPASRNLQRGMERGRITKTYTALVEPTTAIPACGDITLPIAKAHVHAVLRMTASHGQAAHTKIISALKQPSGKYLLRLQPLTGRTHQLRLHCAASGFPIVGDRFYGEVEVIRGQPLHLFCEELALSHPISGKQMLVTIPEDLKPDWSKIVPNNL